MTTNRVYKITDIHSSKSVTDEDWENAMEIAWTWFPEAPAEVREQLAELENDPDWPGPGGSLENMLGLIVEYGPAGSL